MNKLITMLFAATFLAACGTTAAPSFPDQGERGGSGERDAPAGASAGSGSDR